MQRVYARAHLIDFLAPMEELLTVAIDDTANTLFQTGIARIFCHKFIFAYSIYFIFTRLSRLLNVTEDYPDYPG